MANDGLKDPFAGGMGTAAIGMHEMLVSLINAGFTREEAIQLMVAMSGQFVRTQL